MEIKKYTDEYQYQVIDMISKTIQIVNSADYNSIQINEWSNINPQTWKKSLKNHAAIVMLEDKFKVVGYADMTNEGYLDRLYVHYEYQSKGIATELVDYLENNSKSEVFSVLASVTARTFFERMNYKVVEEHESNLNGIAFKNYYMKKDSNNDQRNK